MASPSFFQMRTILHDDDPYPRLRQFRIDDPIHRGRDQRGWFLFRHADVLSLLGDERFSSELGWPDLSRIPKNLRTMMEMRPGWMLNRDAHEHSRLRDPIARTFTPQRVAHLLPRFEATADSLMDACLSRSEFDAIQDYALPLVRGAMAELSGIPMDQRPQFSRLVGDIESTTNTRVAIERNARAVEELGKMFEDLLAARRQKPEDDLISAIANLNEASLTSEERVATCVLVISAGAGVTIGAIGNGVVALLAPPEERISFLREEVDAAGAVDELLRFDSTSAAVVRIAKEEAEISGVRIAKGEKVTGILGSANRDPGAFRNPDRLDLTRGPRDHLGFGRGIHFCIGASLAKAQVRVALQRLLRRSPDLRRTAVPLHWRGGLQRALASLSVRN